MPHSLYSLWPPLLTTSHAALLCLALDRQATAVRSLVLEVRSRTRRLSLVSLSSPLHSPHVCCMLQVQRHERECGCDLCQVDGGEHAYWGCHSMGLVGVLRFTCERGCCINWSSATPTPGPPAKPPPTATAGPAGATAGGDVLGGVGANGDGDDAGDDMYVRSVMYARPLTSQ